MFTHFSKPIDEKFTRKQFAEFERVYKYIESNSYNPGLLHCCASTAFLKYPDMWLNSVRIGSVIQGRTLVKIPNLKKIGTFKSNITEIKNLSKGYNISYSNTYKTKRKTKIAVVPVRIYRWI